MIKQARLALFALCIGLANSAQAAPAAKKAFPPPPKTASPHDVVAWLYAPYLADPQATGSVETGDSADRIKRFATPELARAIARDEACEIKSQGICNLDIDVIIAGQDWNLFDFHQNDELPTGDRQVIRASFSKTIGTAFFFVRHGAAWQIDDVENDNIGANGKVKKLYTLKSLLAGHG